jgi:hypothetical protein
MTELRQRAMAGALHTVTLLALIIATAPRPVSAESGDLVEAGRQIYEDGILPDGSELIATRPEGLILQGRFAACVRCHRASGMGSIEGVADKAILVPPVAGPVLFAPALFADSFLDEEHHYVPHPTWRRAMKRPAYDRESLGAALREGRNTLGESFEAPMLHYDLDEHALSALTAYLETLGAETDPGGDGDKISIGIVVTPDADPDDARAILDVVGAFLRHTKAYGKPLQLAEWRLTGDPDTWLTQMQEGYREQPVFALLSGIGTSEWRPVHEFCEQNRVPCILPSVDAVPATGGHFSVYFSPGVELEAAILAQFLDREPPDGSVIQLFGDASGRKAAARLSDRLGGAGIEAQPRKFRVTAPSLSLHGISDEDVTLLWLGADELEQLASLVEAGLPGDVYFSATLADPSSVKLPQSWRSRVRFVTLDDDISVQTEVARLRLARWLEQQGLAGHNNRRLQADAYVASYLFNAALSRIRRQEIRRPEVPLTREHLLETIESLVSRSADGTTLLNQDLQIAHYGRMSLGPTQRITTRGGSVMMFAPGSSSRFVPVSDRITPR